MERIEADPERLVNFRREQLVLEVTEALVGALVRSGMTRADLAKKMGRTRGHITQLLAGGRNLTLGSIAEMAEALGCKVEVKLQPQARRGAKRGAPAAVPTKVARRA